MHVCLREISLRISHQANNLQVLRIAQVNSRPKYRLSLALEIMTVGNGQPKRVASKIQTKSRQLWRTRRSVFSKMKRSIFFLMVNRHPLRVWEIYGQEIVFRKMSSQKPLKPANRKYASIVLCHNPDAKEILRDFDWDLMLSGHTHGGQFKIPFTDFAPLSPVKDLSMTEGLHEFQNRKIFITRGVGSLYGIRINCRPEASVLEFG